MVSAVVVEDERWARIALLPAARVVGQSASTPPDPHAMARGQRAWLGELEARARRIAGPTPVELATRRGDPGEELLTAAQNASLVLLGRAGRLPARPVGTTATRVALGLALPVVLMREGQALGTPILVLEDTPGVERALVATALLAARDGGAATVVAIAPSAPVRAELLARARAVLAPLHVVVRGEEATSVEAALSARTRRRGETVVLAPGGAITCEDDLARLAAKVDGPVVIA